MNFEQIARDSLPAGVFDTLPQVVKDMMIAKEISAYELAQENERLHAEEEVNRAELERLRAEEQQRDILRARQERGIAMTRELLRNSSVPERVAQTPSDEGSDRPVPVEEERFDISCEFPNNEPNPVSLVDGRVFGFRKETILGLIPRMREIWDRANNRTNVMRGATGYMLFHIWTNNTRRAGTRAIDISDNDFEGDIDELYEALEYLVKAIKDIAEGYEYIYRQGNVSYIHFYFSASYYPYPNCVLNWGNNIQSIEKRTCFDIFTASDLDVPCTVQVAKRIWGSLTNDIITIDDIIKKAGDKLCILAPHIGVKSIKHIRDYSDFIVELNSPIKSLSVIDPNAIYLLHFNEHIGLLENVKEQKRKITHTSFRPVMKFPKTRKVSASFDIECYFDEEKGEVHTPDLCCATFMYDEFIGNVMEFEGRDCIAQMLDYIGDVAKEFGLKHVELIAHNGGNYDFHYLITSMYNPKAIKNILVRGTGFISFDFKHMGIMFTVKDSYNFLQCSLAKAAESFLGEKDRKTDFPHHEVRSEADLQRVFKEWTDIEKKVHTEFRADPETEKVRMLVTLDHIIKYKEGDAESKKLLDWRKEYCVNDVIVLAKVWIRFKQLVSDIFKCEIVDQTYTLAGLSFRLFEANLPVRLDTHAGHGKIKLHHPYKHEYENMRKALIGGRCISVNGQYKNVAALDVKSLYPAAMAYYDQPYSLYRKVTGEVSSELGIYYCRVEPVKIYGHGFFPLRYGKEVNYSNEKIEPYEAWYSCVDMEIGRLEGHKITVIPFEDIFVGYSWKHKGLIFKEYIEGVLYKLKLQYEREKNPEKRHIIKIIMNSLWGKYAQKWMDTSYKILNEAECDMQKQECFKLWDTNAFLVKSHQNKQISSKPIQNGVFILSYARYHMFKIWNKVVIPKSICIYSDTDSIMTEFSNMIKDATFELNGEIVPVIGSEMGQLELEFTFSEFITVGKKQYIGKYFDEKENKIKYKKRFKGVPQQYITPELYTWLLECKDNQAQIKFLKFKREWGCVKGYIDSKTVSQT